MIYKNHEDINPVWDQLLNDYAGDVFIIEVGSGFTEIFHAIEEKKSLIENVDKVIIISTTEAFFSSVWFEVVRKLGIYGVKETDILIEDRGDYINPNARKWFQISNPYLTSDAPLAYVPKSRILLSLARYPRPFRLVMTNELLSRNIVPSDKFLMTCGSASENWDHWYNILPNSSRIFFPIDTFGKVSSYAFVNEGKNHEPLWATSLINLVMESGYNSTSVLVPDSMDMFMPLSESWDRRFFTEKTEKAFRYHQIPILVAPAGYVEYLRNLGYDVFDDFINHSYDVEVDPYVRIKLIAEEVERVCNLLINTDIEDYSTLVDNFHQRTKNNVMNLQKVREKVNSTRTEVVKEFLAS
jgi:hypothetical protein